MLTPEQKHEAEAAALEVVLSGDTSPLPPFDGSLERVAPSPLVRAAAADLRCAATDLEHNQKTNARTFIQSALDKLNESEIDD